MNGTGVVLIALLICAALAVAYVQALRLDAARADMRAERSAHDATRAELARARADVSALSAALDLSRNATAAVQNSLGAALTREARASRDSAARKKILDSIRTRPRTEAERLEVVDDATRALVADRLNRAL